jgi:hypothetical protein
VRRNDAEAVPVPGSKKISNGHDKIPEQNWISLIMP